MTDERFAHVGRVVKTHGLKGEVSVAQAPGTSLEVLIGTAVWFVPPARTVRSAVISSVRPGPKGPLVRFKGIRSVDEASALCGRDVLIDAGDVPAGWHIVDDEPDVIGYRVTDAARGLIGEVTETLITGANDVWVVEGPFGEVLIPVIDSVVQSIDDEEQAIEVTLLDGLLPGEADES